MTEFESTNINQLWQNNIYQNFKNLEEMIRLAYQGCNSLKEYIQMPYEQREIIIVDIQYKNLRMILTELKLLLADVSPIIPERSQQYADSLKKLDRVIENRKLFIKEIKSSKVGTISAHTTEFFRETLNFLESHRQALINEVAEMLFLKTGSRVEINKGRLL